MARLVPDDGRRNARIVIIGEAPGKDEEIQGKPFVGASGARMASWWRAVGLQRSDFYITNVYPYRPPQNKIEAVSSDEIAYWTGQLHERLAALSDPWLIVPTGNTALRALVGKSGITKHRGSIYSYVDRLNRPVKVIPTLHAAATFRQESWVKRCRHDWARIADDATFRELRLPEREHFIKPTIAECWDFYFDAERRADVLVLDIETPRKIEYVERALKSGKIKRQRKFGERRIVCVGYSFEPHFSITIPTTLEYWRDESQLDEAWEIIRRLNALPCVKGGQNAATFDCWWLAQPEYATPVRRYRYDTRWLHHCQDVNDAHDLAYQASIDTREPYWKDDAKGNAEDDKFDVVAESDIETFWRYCGKDAATTCELVDVRLTALGPRLAFYNRHYADAFPAMLGMMLEGIPVDLKTRARRHALLTSERLQIETKLTELAGEPLYAKKSLSGKKVAKFLYETLKIPVQRDRKTGSVTTKEVIIRRLMLRYPQKLQEPGNLILDYRRKAKLSEFLENGKVDADGRIRSSFGFVETLRFSASKNPKKSGMNTQNQDREIRDTFIPLPGMFFLEADLSQAEDRIVKTLAAGVTRDPRRKEILLARARAKPWENDEHKRAAALIFYNDLKAATSVLYLGDERITKPQRYVSKRARHAGNYGMRERQLSDVLLNDGYVYDLSECARFIDTILDRDTPEVREWQKDVRQRVLRDRIVANTWGHILDVGDDRLNDDLFRRCYAFQPQSEVPCIVNTWGFVPLDRMIHKQRMQSRIHLQGHDSLLLSTTLDEGYEIARFLCDSLERPRRYSGLELTIPVEFKIGKTWAGDVEFKQFPDRDEFNAKAKECLH